MHIQGMGSFQGIKGVSGSASHSYCPPVSPPQHGAGALFPASPALQPWVLTAAVPLARAAGAVCEQHARAAPALPVPLRALRQNLHRLLPGQGSLLHLGQQDLLPTPPHREKVSVCPPSPASPCEVMLFRAGKGKRQPWSFTHQPDLYCRSACLPPPLSWSPFLRHCHRGSGTATALSALPQACPLPGRAES